MSATAAERILAVARQQFLEIGFERCSMDSVARSARVSKQSLYELYPTKLDLFATVMRDAARTARLGVESVTADDRDPEAVLSDFVMSFFAGFVTLENRGLFRAALVASRDFPNLATDMHRSRLTGGAPMADYVAKLAQEGRITPRLLPDLHRRFGSTAIEGTRYLLGVPQPTREEQQALTRSVITLLLHGYRHAQGARAGAALPPEPPALALPETAASLRLPPQRLEALLDAAAADFLAQGFCGGNLTRIAASVGVGPATIYRQFGNKEGLFRRAMLHVGQRLWSDDTPGPAEGETLDAALYELARWTLDRHLMPDSLALQRLLIMEAEQFPETARWAYERMVWRPTRELHARLMKFGAPAPDAILARAFYTLATYSVRFVAMSDGADEETRAALSRECVDLFLTGCAQ